MYGQHKFFYWYLASLLIQTYETQHFLFPFGCIEHIYNRDGWIFLRVQQDFTSSLYVDPQIISQPYFTFIRLVKFIEDTLCTGHMASGILKFKLSNTLK